MLEGFLDVLDLPSATLVAHDSGAVVARALAARRPERAAGLVLSDTELPHLAVPSAHRLQKLFSLPGGARAFEMLLGSRFFWRHVLARSAISDRAAFDVEEFVATHLAPLASREKRRASRRFALQWDLGFVDALPHERLTMPKLVLWGDRDAFVSLARARDFYDALPGPKEFARIARCGTLPHEERPDAWVASVRAFLDLGRADDRMPASS